MNLPPGYVEQVQRAIGLIRTWCEQYPGPGVPDLRFRDLDGRIMYTGNLDTYGRQWLGLSEDARALLRYIDSETAHKMTIFQATTALRYAGFIPQ